MPGRPTSVTSRSIRSLAAQDLQARGAVDGLERPVALLAQHLQDHAAHHRLVLDHQHGLAGSGVRGVAGRRGLLGRDSLGGAADRA